MRVFHLVTKVRIIETFLLLLVVDVFLYAGLLFFVFIDKEPGKIQALLYGLLKYIFGFPLVLLNRGMPFFLDGQSPGAALFFGTLLVNNLLLALLFWIAAGIVSNKVKQ